MMARHPACKRCEIQYNRILPMGSSSPDIYIILEAPTEDDFDTLLNDRAGEMLRKIMDDLGIDINDRVRVSTAVACKPTDLKMYPRSPTHEEIQNCSSAFLIEDIKNSNPKVIVALGHSARFSILPDVTESLTASIGKEYEYMGIPVLVGWHPKYVLKQGDVSSTAYTQLKSVLIRANKKSLGESLKDDEVDYEIIDADSVEDVDRFFDLFLNDSIVALDYEASGLDVFSPSFKVGGIGISSKSVNAYLRIQSAEDVSNGVYRLDNEEVRNQIALRLKELCDQARVLVYNMRYEYTLSYAQFGVRLTLYDVLQQARTLGITGGLKSLSTLYLHKSSWTGDIDEYYEALSKLTSGFKTYRGGLGPIHSIVHDSDSADQFIDNVESKFNNANKDILSAVNTLLKYISVDTLFNIMKYHGRLPSSIRESAGYNEIPIDLVSKYCIEDCINTIELHEYFNRKLKSIGVDDQVVEYYNQHARLACELSINGVRWDDEEAEIQRKKISESITHMLREILLMSSDKLDLSPVDIIKIKSATDYGQLTKYWNPNSNHHTARDILNLIQVNNRLRFMLLMSEVIRRAENNDNKNLPTLSEIVNSIISCESKDKLKLTDQYRRSVKSYWNKLTTEEKRLMGEFHEWKLPGTSQEVYAEIFRALTLCGVDFNSKDLIDEAKIALYVKLVKKALKAKGTYIEGSVGRAAVSVVKKNDPTKRVRSYTPSISDDELHIWSCEWGANTAHTKRWTSTYHTIPSGSSIRKIFKSRFGTNGIILKFDYSQQELRVLARLANEEKMLDAFQQGADIHKLVASDVFQCSLDEVTKEQRRFSKMINFGVLYGKSVWTFAIEYMNGNVKRAEKFFEDYFNRFPGIQEYIKNQHEMLEKNGYVTTMWGDPIWIEYNPHNEKELNEARRQAQNYGIQSTASNVAGLCIARLADHLITDGYKSRPFGFTHDSGEFDLHIDELFYVLSIIKDYTEGYPLRQWNLPIVIDLELGVDAYHLVSMDEMVLKNGSITAKIKGQESSVNYLIDRLNQHYRVSYDQSTQYEEYIPYDEYFETRKAYTDDVGKSLTKVEGVISIERIS